MTMPNGAEALVSLHEPLNVFAPGDAQAVPIHLVASGQLDAALSATADRRWAETANFKAAAKAQLLLPAADATLAGVLLGAGNGTAGEPSGPSDLLLGHIAGSLPAGTYKLGSGFSNPDLAALSWALGAYRYRRYRARKSNGGDTKSPQLALPPNVDRARLTNTAEAVWLGRDLINTP